MKDKKSVKKNIEKSVECSAKDFSYNEALRHIFKLYWPPPNENIHFEKFKRNIETFKKYLVSKS